MSMYVVQGSASKGIASHLARELQADLADVEIRRFADGECYIRVKSNLRGEDVIIVQNTYPDENIIEMLLLKSAVKDLNPNRIFLVIPYYGYARQDRKFQDGEVVSAKVLAEILSMDVDGLITVDPHKEYIVDFFKTRGISCSAVPEIARYLANKDIDVLLAPDKGAVERVKKSADILKCEYDFLEKERLTDEIVEIKPKSLSINSKGVAIIDDIISTGGTMAKAVGEIKKLGAKRIYVACTHGLFIGDAVVKIEKAGANEIISTDTIESSLSKVKVAPQIAKAMKELLN